MAENFVIKQSVFGQMGKICAIHLLTTQTKRRLHVLIRNRNPFMTHQLDYE